MYILSLMKSLKVHPNCKIIGFWFAILTIVFGTLLFYASTIASFNTNFHYYLGVIYNVTGVDASTKLNQLPFSDSFDSPYLVSETNTTKIKSDYIFHIAVLLRPVWQMVADFKFSVCEYSNCVFNFDRVTQRTDVIVVYSLSLRENYTLTLGRPDALYVMELWEPPVNTDSSFMKNSSTIWNNVFNLTMTYRVDSDIFVPYGKLIYKPKPIEERPDYYQLSQQKSRSVAWFVSRCRAASLRFNYVKEMQKYIDVDIYGSCGIPCNRIEEPCMHNLTKTYKFYLSFENSMCKDYITEKLFKLFRPGIHVIPVVRGGGDYNKFFPKNLFINAANFQNAKSLALFLKNLSTDLDTYSKMLEHKDKYVMLESHNTAHRDSLGWVGCNLCEFLNTHKIQPKVYDIKKWWADETCVKPQDIV